MSSTITRNSDVSRYLYLNDEDINLDNNGLLVRYDRWRLSDKAIGIEKAVDLPGGIIIAEGGMGKTTYLESLCILVQEPTARMYKLGEYISDSNTLGEEITQWVDSLEVGIGSTLILDGLDEAPDLAGGIVRKLRTLPESIKIWIASRDVEQIRSIQASLETRATKIRTYRLAPLSRQNLSEFASAQKIEPDAFIDAVEREGVTTICSKPIGCLHALELFQQNGLVGATQMEIWDAGLMRLCDENRSPTRALVGLSKFTVQEVYECTAWIAVNLILSGSQFVWSEESSYCPDHTISLESLVLTEVPIALLRETVSRGVFSPLGDGRHKFYHKLYLDYMAAIGVNKYIPAQNWSSLFISADQNQIFLQHIQLVTFLSVLNESFLKEVASIQPEILLLSRDTVDLIGRETLTSALLNRAPNLSRHERSFGQYQKYLSNLTHVELGETLSSVLRDKSSPPTIIEMAIEIATECACKEIADLLATRMLNHGLDLEKRKAAGWALRRIGTPKARERLAKLLPISPKDDPLDDLRGLTLHALWPDHLSNEELVLHLTPKQAKNYGGAYSFFLRQYFVKTLSSNPEDQNLAPLLEWAVSNLRKNEPFDSIGEVARVVYTYAWKLNTPELDPLLARGYTAGVKNYYSPFLSLDDSQSDGPVSGLSRQDFDSNLEKRKGVMKEIIRDVPEGLDLSNIWVNDYPLYTQVDLNWLFEEVKESCEEDERRNWAVCIKGVSRIADIQKYLTLFVEMHHKFPELFDDPEVTIAVLKEGEAKYQLQQDKWNLEHKKRLEKAVQTQDNILTDIKSHLDNQDTPASAFGGIASWLFSKDGRRELGTPDLSEAPLWQMLSKEQQKQMMLMAKLYLTDCTFTPTEKGNHDYSLAQALTLLRLMQPDVFQKLGGEIWSKAGIELIKATFGSNSEYMDPLLDRLSQEYPTQATESLLEVVKQELEEGHFFSLQTWGNRLTSKQAEQCIQILNQSEVPTKVKTSLLLQLAEIEIGQTAVTNYLERIFNAGWTSHPEAEYHRLRSLLFECEPVRYIEVLLKGIDEDPEWGKEWLQTVVRRESLLSPFTKCSPEQIAHFYAWLHTQYPPANEPKHEGAYSPSSIDEVYMLEKHILGHLTRSGRPGCADSLEWLGIKFPSEDWFGDCAIEARKLETAHLAPLLRIKVIKELRDSEEASRRVVLNIVDLAKVVCESVDNYQIRLQGDNARISDLWELGLNPKPRDEEYLSDHLKDYLDLVLTNGIVINREVQIERKKYKDGKPGSRTDLWIQAIADGGDVLTYCIEVKCNWNPSSNTAIRDQLVDKYLSGGTASGGMLLLGWYECKNWDTSDPRQSKSTVIWDDSIAALADLESQASSLNKDGCLINAKVLNCMLS
ncbi:HEAT repeat domain-containing protein [Kiritimatiellaeota bacterium B1221]|nr:HEAT repeat domain-containing protein [Kiritimatiellaeota bacterium B1221]